MICFDATYAEYSFTFTFTKCDWWNALCSKTCIDTFFFWWPRPSFKTGCCVVHVANSPLYIMIIKVTLLTSGPMHIHNHINVAAKQIKRYFKLCDRCFFLGSRWRPVCLHLRVASIWLALSMPTCSTQLFLQTSALPPSLTGAWDAGRAGQTLNAGRTLDSSSHKDCSAPSKSSSTN